VIISRTVLRFINVSDRCPRENKKKILYAQKFFPPEDHSIYEIMWKNMAEPERPQMTR
jgi:hypothetical protein